MSDDKPILPQGIVTDLAVLLEKRRQARLCPRFTLQVLEDGSVSVESEIERPWTPSELDAAVVLLRQAARSLEDKRNAEAAPTNHFGVQARTCVTEIQLYGDGGAQVWTLFQTGEFMQFVKQSLRNAAEGIQ